MVHNSVVRNTFVAQKEVFVRKEAEERNEAEELYEVVTKSSPVGVYIVQDGRFCYVNPRFQQISGYNEKELLNMNPLEIVHPEDRQRVQDHAVAMLKGQIHTPCQFRAIGRDGEVRWGVETTTSVMYRGKRASLGNFIDITESIRAEQALMESEEKFSKAFYASPNTMAITTVKDGKFIDTNNSHTVITGYTREETIGHTAVELGLWYKEEDRDRMKKLLKEKGRVTNEEFLFRMKSGEIRNWLFSAEPITVGGELCMISMTIDITELRLAEEALKESEDKFSKAFLGSPAMVSITTRKDGRFIEVNDSFLKFYGYKREEIIGSSTKAINLWVKMEDRVRMLKILEEQGSVKGEEFNQRSKSGKLCTVVLSAEKVSIKNEPCLLVTAIDITDRKHMEEKLKHNMEELQVANDKLRELDKMKDSFLSTVSHELRTPLTSIKSFAEILLTYDEDKETQREFLNIINQESDRLTKLINDFLDLSKIEAGRMQWDDKEQSLIPIIQNALNVTHALAKEKSLKVEFIPPEDLPIVSCDKDRVVQVITNLLSNAIKFTPEMGKVTVGVKTVRDKNSKKGSDKVVVSVTDTGIGIAPENQDAVFEKFKQVGDTLTDKPKGTGLGLPICKEIIEHYGGEIWLESEEGKGSTFSFSLPVIKTEEVVAPIPEVKEKPEKEVKEGKIILVVDDEENIRNFLTHELKKKGYSVIQAANGKDALSMAREHHPDLITLDVQMPDISGFDVTSVLKNDDETKDIPILILSVIEDKFKAYKLGANDCMTKPFDNDELVEKVNQLLIGTKKSVLVVDDDRSLVKSVKYHLEHKGYSTCGAYDGEQALEIVKEHAPDLIVLDVIMPNKDGYEVIKTLKSSPATAEIPIVLMTGIEIDGGRVKALSVGAADYITKSGDFNKLYDAIDNILASKVSA